ncbi:hypothetical protein ACFL02_08670 [Planctomycetota bacterium]
MKKFITILAVMIMTATGAVNAAINLDFTEVNVGNSSQVDLTNQFWAYGVTFDHVYRYLDGRDPWLEMGPQGGPIGYGISNGWIIDGTIPGALGTVFFTNPTPYVTIDWWDLASFQLTAQAYDAGNILLDTFVGPVTPADDFGTRTLSGPGLISYMTFHDGGGYVQIANMTYAPIPAPGAILLAGLGAGLVGWMRKRKTI